MKFDFDYRQIPSKQATRRWKYIEPYYSETYIKMNLQANSALINAFCDSFYFVIEIHSDSGTNFVSSESKIGNNAENDFN